MGVEIKKNILFVVFSFLLIIISGSLVSATNYYIRAGASGNNDGSDWTNAYTDLPSDLIRGDTYYIADGNYGGHTFDDAESGSEFITIKKATISDHGVDTGWQDSYGDGQAVFWAIAFSSDNWIFDGMTGGGPGSWKSGFGFEVYVPGHNNNAITFSGALSNIAIRHVDAHVYPADTPETSMTNFYQVFKGTTGGCANISFQYVWFHNTFGCMFQLASQWPGPLLIEYSYFSQNRNTAEWHAAGIASHGANNVTVRYNIWEDIDGSAVIDGIETGTMDYWYVYGNVIWTTDSYGAVSPVISCHNDASNNIKNNHWRVYGNSIINMKGTGRMTWYDPQGNDILVKNNLWYQNRQNDEYINYVYIQGSGVSWDYNWYSATAHPGAFVQGPHENALYWGPNCKLSRDTTDYFTDWRNGDFSLSSTPDAGVTLTNEFAAGILQTYNTDMFGNIRGADGVWDRGAYEHVSSASCNFDSDCDDGLFCNGAEICSGGTCQAGTSPCIDDGYSCTTLCDEATDSCNVPNNALCNDGIACTTDTCVGSGGDSSGCSITPNDNLCLPLPSGCTSGTCDVNQGCVYLPEGCSSESDLLLWLPFNGNANDESGNNNHGTVNGAVLTSDKDGNSNSAYMFDGIDDYIGVVDNGLDGMSELSVCLWTNIVSKSTWDYILSKNNDPFTTSSYGMGLDNSADQKIIFTIRTSTGTATAKTNSAQNLAQWYHICGIYNGSEVSIWQNGIKQTETGSNTGSITDTTLPVKLGMAESSLNFNGIIGDVRIYNKALSSTEIQALYSGAVSQCSSADTDNDSIVDLDELYAFIERWRNNEVVIGDLMATIGEWKYGC